MRNRERWTPSKFVLENGLLKGSRNPQQVSIGSRLMADRLANFFQNAIPRHARGRLLDLGCGAAPLFATYQTYVSDIVCVDWGQGAHGNDYLDLEHDLTSPLPLDAEAFDTIILSDVLEHLPDPDAIWSEMARLLSVGGKVIVTVPFLYGLHERPHDYCRYTEFALRRFADRHGFEIIEMTALGGAPEVLVDIFSKTLGRSRLGRTATSMIQGFVRWAASTKRGRRFSEGTSARFPYGYALVARKI